MIIRYNFGTTHETTSAASTSPADGLRPLMRIGVQSDHRQAVTEGELNRLS